MSRTLTDEDCEVIAAKVVEALARRLSPLAPAKPPEQPHPEKSEATAGGLKKQAYSANEVAEMLGVSKVTVWRLRLAGRIRPVEGIRHIIFSRAEVDRFLNASAADASTRRNRR